MRLRQTQGSVLSTRCLPLFNTATFLLNALGSWPGRPATLLRFTSHFVLRYSLLIAVQFKSNSPKFWNTWSEYKFHAQSYDLSFVGICKQRFKFNMLILRG